MSCQRPRGGQFIQISLHLEGIMLSIPVLLSECQRNADAQILDRKIH